MILNIPHSGTDVMNRNIQQRDINHLTDWFTDELFFHKHSERLVQNVSRFVCDCERFPDDKEPMFLKGQGICYTKGTTDNTIEVIDKEEIINTIYNPYHKKLNSLTRRWLTLFCKVVIVDCHSFTPDKNSKNIDFCIGTNPDTPKDLIDVLLNFIKDNGYSSAENYPYSGAIVPSDFINNDDVYSIMIEVNKNLYLTDEFKKNESFDSIKLFINALLNKISEYEEAFDA